jgi:hypothetical protein
MSDNSTLTALEVIELLDVKGTLSNLNDQWETGSFDLSNVSRFVERYPDLAGKLREVGAAIQAAEVLIEDEYKVCVDCCEQYVHDRCPCDGHGEWVS